MKDKEALQELHRMIRADQGLLDGQWYTIVSQGKQIKELQTQVAQLQEAMKMLGLQWKEESTIPAHWEKKPKQ